MLPYHTPDTPDAGEHPFLDTLCLGKQPTPTVEQEQLGLCSLDWLLGEILGMGWRGMGQRHPHVSAGALSSHAVAQGSTLMEHEIIQSRLGSTGSDLNGAQVFLPPEAGLRELQHPYGNLHLMLACLPPVCILHMWSVRKSRINSKESCY